VARFGVDAAADMTGTAASGTYRIVFWRLMPVLMLCYILNYLDRSNIGLAKLAFMKDLGMPETAYGLAGGAFYLGYISLGVPVNIALGRIGARKSLLLIMLFWGLFSALLAFITTPLHFYILRFLIGVSETGFLPAVLLYLSRWVPGSQRARFNGIFLAAIAIAGLIGGPLGGYILSHADGVLGLKAWQFLFLIEGLPACVMGVAVFFYLRERPCDAPWLDAAQKDQIEKDLAVSAAGRVTHGGLLQALRDKRFWALVPIAMAGSIGTSGIGLWLPTIINQTGVADVMVVGLLSAIPYAAAIVVQFLNAHHSDRTGERRWHAAGPLMIAAAGWCVMPFLAHDPWASIAVMTLVAAATFAFTGPFWSMPTAMLSGTAAAGGLGFITTMLGLGSFVSPVLVGWLSDKTHSFAAGEYFYAGVLLLGGGALILGTRRGR
jgi:MFS family permease